MVKPVIEHLRARFNISPQRRTHKTANRVVEERKTQAAQQLDEGRGKETPGLTMAVEATMGWNLMPLRISSMKT